MTRAARQRAQHHLRSWKYYEKNIVALKSDEILYPKIVMFFHSLKKLDKGEIAVLAERYYKSEIGQNFSNSIGDYRMYKPIEYDVISLVINEPKEILPSIYGRIEIKLGEYIIQDEEIAIRSQADVKLDKMEELTVWAFSSSEERKILEKAFDEIRKLRGDKPKHEFEHWFRDPMSQREFYKLLEDNEYFAFTESGRVKPVKS